MARYNSSSTEEPGQYPTTAWSQMGLPEQNYGSGAPGTSRPSAEIDPGRTNEPGQYPSSMPFAGTDLGGSGAPGSQGARSSLGGSDSVTVTRPSFYKGEHEPGGLNEGAVTYDASGTVSGQGDWTQANDEGYGGSIQMPGVRGNTPDPNNGPFQPSGGSVMYGGRLNGTGHTSTHPRWSGPGT